MAEASIQVRPEIVEMPVPVTRENTVVIGGITGVFPEGTLEITENGTYDVTLKEAVNVDIPQDPEIFFNPEISGDLNVSFPKTTLDFLADFIKEIPTLHVGEGVTKLSPSPNPFADVMNGKRLKLTGGSNAITPVNIGRGDNSYHHGPILVDLSELTVSPTASFDSVCSDNDMVEEAYLPRQEVESTNLGYSFYGCSALKKADLGGVIGKPGYTFSYTFRNTSALEQLIIRNTTRVFQATSNMFTGSAIAAGTCQIYVPDSLVDAYKADGVWGTYAAQIHPLSELPEE